MGKRRLTCLLMCLLLLLGLNAPAFAEETTGTEATEEETTAMEETAASPTQITSADVDASVVNGCNGVDAQVPLRNDKLLETGTAGVLYEVTSGTLMYAENMDIRVYPGSFVKLMTALLAIEQGSLSDEIIVTSDALNTVPENSSVQGLLEGEVLTLEELLYSMIVASANDSAAVIANYIAGSQDAFVAAMNQKAAEIGCMDTNYTNVHGVHDDMQYTTPRDLLKIMVYALHYDIFQELIGAAQYYIPETNLSESRQLYSTNYMLSQLIMEGYYDNRVTGGKVASNQDGERSLIVTAKADGLSYIGIVTDTKPVYSSNGYSINEYREFTEMKSLLDLGFDNYEVKQILYEGQITDRLTVTNGTNSVAVGPVSAAASVLPKSVSSSGLSFRFQKLDNVISAPVEKGEIVNVVQVWYGSVCIAQSEIAAMNSSDVAAATLQSTQENTEENGAGLTKVLAVFGIILIVIIGFAAVLYIIRMIRTAALRSKRRRRRSSRRRSR